MIKKVSLRDVFDTLQVYLGSLYMNDFNQFGRTWQVNVQAEPRFRDRARGRAAAEGAQAHGQMVPLGTVADVKEVNGPLIVTRYNMYPAAPINGSRAPGVSSGEAIEMMEGLADAEPARDDGVRVDRAGLPASRRATPP